VADLVQEKLSIKISKWTAITLLRRLGYRHGKLKRRIVLDNKRIARVEKFMKRYAGAKEEEKDGTSVIVVTDETYLHNTHARKIGWFWMGDYDIKTTRINAIDVQQEVAPVNDSAGPLPTGDRVPRSKGQRLIVVHALTRNGLVAPLTEDGGYNEDICRCPYNSIGMEDKLDTAEWVFQADARLTDYHKNMDGVMFMRWVNNQLIPSLKKLYAGRKIRLFLDNAPYHGTYPENSINPKKLTKAKCIEELQAMIDRQEMEEDKEEISTLKTERKSAEVTFGVIEWALRGNKSGTGGPYAEEVQDHLLKVATKYERERLKTDLVLAFEQEGWEVDFTPPYEPKFQPIERGWGHSKNVVAEEWRGGRNLKDTYEDLMTAWYGGVRFKTKKPSVGITSERAKGWFTKSEADMNAWISKHGEMASGT
jgi:hypothetical protein